MRGRAKRLRAATGRARECPEDFDINATPVPTPRSRVLAWLVVIPVIAWSTGCAAFTNPTAYEGIPVNRLPDEVLGRPRSELQPIPLNMLRLKEPPEYR